MARTILSLPRIVIALLWLLSLPVEALLRALGNTESSQLLLWPWPWITSVAWAWALLTVLTPPDHKPPRFALTRLLYPLSIGFLALSALVPDDWPNDTLLPPSFFAILLAIWMMGVAAYRLDKFEHPTRLSIFWPAQATAWWTMAILALPIGIWFLKPRTRGIAR